MPGIPRGRAAKRRRPEKPQRHKSEETNGGFSRNSSTKPIEAQLEANSDRVEQACDAKDSARQPTANNSSAETERGTDDVLQTLLLSFPGRGEQIKDLLSIVLGYRSHEQISARDIIENPCGLAGSTALFAYGAAATGKTAVVNAVLRACRVPFASVNCIEACTPRLLFEQILRQLLDFPAGMVPATDKTKESATVRTPLRCESLHTFFEKLRDLYPRTAGCTTTGAAPWSMPTRTTYIVLDNAERLRTLPPHILPAILRISEIIKLPVCPILISSIVWEKFRGGTGCLEPQLMHFPAYTKHHALSIMTMHLPLLLSSSPEHVDGNTTSTAPEISPATEELLQRQFCGLLYDVFHGPCRDLNELRHVAHLLYPMYLEPVRAGGVAVDNAGALYRSIVPHFKKQLSRLYLREMSSAEWSAVHVPAAALPGATPRYRTLELPFLSKYILIAAYLASYNPANTDARMFAKRQSKSRGSRRGASKKRRERVPQYLLGPKAFPLDRLLAILYSLVEMKTDASAEVYSQISTLVTLRLLSLVSSTDNLHTPRYKCSLTLSEVQRVATSVSVDITRYMHDAELH
eukprot:m.301360 g.301360  ORF g.301360 m.301360 type:complete len:577 (+) comp20140_c0_seq2:164-1894(+)